MRRATAEITLVRAAVVVSETHRPGRLACSEADPDHDKQYERTIRQRWIRRDILCPPCGVQINHAACGGRTTPLCHPAVDSASTLGNLTRRSREPGMPPALLNGGSMNYRQSAIPGVRSASTKSTALVFELLRMSPPSLPPEYAALKGQP